MSYSEHRFSIGMIIVSVVSGLFSGMIGSLLVAVYYRPLPSPSLASPVTERRENPSVSSSGSLGDDTTVAVVRRTSAAVVSITISKEMSTSNKRFPAGFDPFGGENPFFFFEDSPANANPKDSKEKQVVGGGSGFLVSSDGLIVTNKHVVADSEAEYTVMLADGSKKKATVLAMDPSLDLAFVKIDGSDYPFLELGNSEQIQVGQTTIAIGYALAEFKNTVTKGVVSGINRRLVAGSRMGSELIEGAIQTDAAINQGNSGGPLLDLNGRVIGVNTAVSSNGQSVGFALPSNLVKRDMESIKRSGKIVRPWLGVRYVMIDDEYAKRHGINVRQGALIIREDRSRDPAVVPTSPADKVGLVENDILLSLDGVSLDLEHSLAQLIAQRSVGDEVTLRVLHQGKEKTVRVKLEERKIE